MTKMVNFSFKILLQIFSKSEKFQCIQNMSAVVSVVLEFSFSVDKLENFNKKNNFIRVLGL